jgi:hypothetical protein
LNDGKSPVNDGAMAPMRKGSAAQGRKGAKAKNQFIFAIVSLSR